jgi:hypothetical protein
LIRCETRRALEVKLLKPWNPLSNVLPLPNVVQPRSTWMLWIASTLPQPADGFILLILNYLNILELKDGREIV